MRVQKNVYNSHFALAFWDKIRIFFDITLHTFILINEVELAASLHYF